MNKKLYKSKTDKKIAGVCGGIAEYLNLDSTLIRLLFVLLACSFGSGLIVYLVSALIIPDSNEENNKEKEMKVLHKSLVNRRIAGVCGGIAEYFNMDVTVIRLMWVFSCIFLGFGLAAYIIMAIIMPTGE